MNRVPPSLLRWLRVSVVAALASFSQIPWCLGDELGAPAYPDHTRLMEVRDGTGNVQPVRSRAEWDVRRAHILAHLQDVMGKLPGGERRVPLDLRIVSTSKESGYTRKKITFATEPSLSKWPMLQTIAWSFIFAMWAWVMTL